MSGVNDILEFLRRASVEDLNKILQETAVEIFRRNRQYYEITISSNVFKGSGKCWIRRIEKGVPSEFVNPVDVDCLECRTKETFRLSPGEYLVCEEGGKDYDSLYKIRVNPDFTAEEIK